MVNELTYLYCTRFFVLFLGISIKPVFGSMQWTIFVHLRILNMLIIFSEGFKVTLLIL